MALNRKALHAILASMFFYSSAFASPDPHHLTRFLPYLPVTGGPALVCAMVFDYLGNDQIWFENVSGLFDDDTETRIALDKVIGGPVEPGEPIQVRGVFSRWVNPNAFMLGVGNQEILVVGKSSLFSDPSLNAWDLTVVGVYYSGLNEFCRKGQGTVRFIKADRIFSGSR